MIAIPSIPPFRSGGGQRHGRLQAESCVCADIRSPTASTASPRTKGVKLFEPTTEKELLPEDLCYCLGSGHLRSVKGIDDYASRRGGCEACRPPA